MDFNLSTEILTAHSSSVSLQNLFSSLHALVVNRSAPDVLSPTINLLLADMIICLYIFYFCIIFSCSILVQDYGKGNLLLAPNLNVKQLSLGTQDLSFRSVIFHHHRNIQMELLLLEVVIMLYISFFHQPIPLLSMFF